MHNIFRLLVFTVVDMDLLK